MKSLWLGGVLWAGAMYGQTVPPVPERVAVPAEKSYTAKAFEYTRVPRERGRTHEIYDVRYPSPVVSPYESNNTVPGELYLPAGTTPEHGFPAVVCLHILNGNFDLERLLCTRLAQGGVVALFFKQPYYGERRGEAGKELLDKGAGLLTGGLEQGLEDARRALDILGAMPEVNPERLGITGISLGAIQSAAVCGREPRVHKAFLTLVGCDLRRIILTARETRELRAFIDGLPPEEQRRVWEAIDRVDPLRAQEALRKLAQGGNLRMVCAEKDEVVPPECGRRLAEAIGFADRVTWLPGLGHYTAMARFPQIMGEEVAFFGADVPSWWRPPAGNGEKTPVELLGVFLSGLAAFAGGEPAKGTAHFAGVNAEVNAGGKGYHIVFDYVRGERGRFKLEGEFPVGGRAGFGQGEYPWLVCGQTSFCGTSEQKEGGTAGAFVTPERLMRYQVAMGALAGVAMSPEALKQYYTLAESSTTNGERVVEVKINSRKLDGSVSLEFARDATPLGAAWVFGDARGKVRFTHWRLNSVADDAIFDAPAGLARKTVRQEDLQRLFATVFELALAATE